MDMDGSKRPVVIDANAAGITLLGRSCIYIRLEIRLVTSASPFFYIFLPSPLPSPYSFSCVPSDLLRSRRGSFSLYLM
jgi:hypothetical protein